MANKENPCITFLWRNAPENLPQLVNHPDYEGTIPCLVFRRNTYEILYYDCYNKCWNDASDDDYECSNETELKYIQLEED
jgi:hypothetical protein